MHVGFSVESILMYVIHGVPNKLSLFQGTVVLKFYLLEVSFTAESSKGLERLEGERGGDGSQPALFSDSSLSFVFCLHSRNAWPNLNHSPFSMCK